MARLTHSRQLYNWLRDLLHWLFDAHLFWLACGGVIASLLVVVRKGASEQEIRITGLVLQGAGILTVAWGIRQTRILFGRDDIVTLARNWLHGAPIYGRRVGSLSVDFTLPSLKVDSSGYESSTATLNATIEERIDVLEKNVKQIHSRIDQTRADIDQDSRAQSAALEKERQERSEQVHTLGAKLEVTETGGLNISAMGVLWLFVGIILSTIPLEIVKWLK